MVKHRLHAEILLGQLSPENTQRGHVQRLPDLRTIWTAETDLLIA